MFASLMKHAHEGLIFITITSQWARWRSQITSLTSVYPTVYSGADQRKPQSSASLAFVWGIQRSSGPVNSPHKGPVTRKYFHLITSSWQNETSRCNWQSLLSRHNKGYKHKKNRNFVIKAKKTGTCRYSDEELCALYVCNKPILFDPYHEMTKLWNNKNGMLILLSFRIEVYFAHISTYLDTKLHFFASFCFTKVTTSSPQILFNCQWFLFQLHRLGLRLNNSDSCFIPAKLYKAKFDGILPKGPYPPCLRMADKALLAGYHRIIWRYYVMMCNNHITAPYKNVVNILFYGYLAIAWSCTHVVIYWASSLDMFCTYMNATKLTLMAMLDPWTFAGASQNMNRVSSCIHIYTQNEPTFVWYLIVNLNPNPNICV